jgi:uncharacterized protein YpmB
MANITLNSSTYAGYFSDVTLAASVLGARTIEQGYVTLHTNVDDKYTVVFADSDVAIEDANGTFSSSSTADLSEIKFELGKYMINAEIDYKNLDNFWLASQQPRGAAGDYVPPASLEDALNAHFAQKASLFVGASIWSGSALAVSQFGSSQGISQGGSNSVTGLIDTMLADADVVDIAVGGTYKQTITGFSKAADAIITVANTDDYAIGDKITFEGLAGSASWTALNGTTVAIKSIPSSTTLTIETDTSAFTGTYTASSGSLTCINKNNVVAAFEEVYRNMSDSIRLAPDTVFYVPSRVAAAYKLKQAEAAYSPNVYSQDYELSFLGYRVLEIPEMRNNAIVCSRIAGLHFATPLISDLNQVLIVDQSTTSASRTIRYRLDFAFDVAISDGKNITLLS